MTVKAYRMMKKDVDIDQFVSIFESLSNAQPEVEVILEYYSLPHGVSTSPSELTPRMLAWTCVITPGRRLAN
jgi:hypothetical protein